jgi:hypothetical protein
MLCLCVLDLLFPMLLTMRSETERPSSQPLDGPFLMLYTITEQVQFNICFLPSICKSEHTIHVGAPPLPTVFLPAHMLYLPAYVRPNDLQTTSQSIFIPFTNFAS